MKCIKKKTVANLSRSSKKVLCEIIIHQEEIIEELNTKILKSSPPPGV